MKNFLFVFCLLFAIHSFSQTINGTVVDENKQPLPGANIYFDRTTIATSTDENGKFTLYTSGKINSLLAISYLGYQTQYISEIGTNPLYIILKEVSNTLNEVVINKKDKFTRKEKMKLFRDQFLGKTSSAKSCKIENEDAVYFRYDKKTKTIKAFSDVPLQITNEALGYQIVYELVNFEVRFHSETLEQTTITRSFYAGLSYFKEFDSSDKVLKKRAKSFQGSQLHFFRNMTNNLWDKDNFLLFKNGHMADAKTVFTVSDAGDNKMVQIAEDERIQLGNKKFMAQFQVLFNKKLQSGIQFETNTFYVDKFGNNSNIEDMMFSGDLSSRKVGDMLPLNYGIE